MRQPLWPEGYGPGRLETSVQVLALPLTKYGTWGGLRVSGPQFPH